LVQLCQFAKEAPLLFISPSIYLIDRGIMVIRSCNPTIHLLWKNMAIDDQLIIEAQTIGGNKINHTDYSHK
jgi:hypothetical protein